MNKTLAAPLLIAVIGQVVNFVALYGIIQGDLQGFTDAVVAVVSGLVAAATGITYILAHVDFNKKKLENTNQTQP